MSFCSYKRSGFWGGLTLSTVFDVAKLAGVSIATVSRVLRGSSHVAEETRGKVLAAVDELKYFPNRMAQGLRSGLTNTVAFAVGDIEQSVYSTLAKHLQLVLEPDRLDLMLFNLGHSHERLVGLFESARFLGLRAIVLATSDEIDRSLLLEHAGRLAEHGIMLICIHQDASGLGIPSVAYDDTDAVRRSVHRLLAAGKGPVAYLGKISGSALGARRYRGYVAALEASGTRLDSRLVWDTYYRHKAGYEALAAAVKAGIDFHAVQAGSDELAMGAAGALIDAGRAVPDDVAVVGFGNVAASAFTRPSLSTITSNPEAVAENVRDILRAHMDGSEPKLLTVLQRDLVLRSSG